jgi:hypothetical protein
VDDGVYALQPLIFEFQDIGGDDLRLRRHVVCAKEARVDDDDLVAPLQELRQ